MPESALESVQFVESKSDYDAESRAMTLLAEKRLPVVLVLNARTNDESIIQQDPDTDEQIGNFPQAFTHMALINNAMRVERIGDRH